MPLDEALWYMYTQCVIKAIVVLVDLILNGKNCKVNIKYMAWVGPRSVFPVSLRDNTILFFMKNLPHLNKCRWNDHEGLSQLLQTEGLSFNSAILTQLPQKWKLFPMYPLYMKALDIECFQALVNHNGSFRSIVF